MIVYILTLILVSITGYFAYTIQLNNKNYINDIRYKTWVNLTVLILALVAGLRYRVGTDYMNYAIGYDNILLTWWDSILTFDEPGYKILTVIASCIYDDYVSMFMIMSFFTIGINVKTISKYSDHFLLGIIFYLLIGAWHGTFGAVRQYAAAAVLFWGHRYIYDKKFYKYTLVVFCAMLFHRTALIMLPIYFVVKKEFSVKNILIMVGVAVVMAMSTGVFFDIMTELKGNDQTLYEYMNTRVNTFRVFFSVLPVLLVFFTSEQFKSDSLNAFYINLLMVNAAFMVATSSSANLARVGIYTDIFSTIAFPKLISGFNYKSRNIIRYVLLLLYFIFFIYEISVRETLYNFMWIFER